MPEQSVVIVERLTEMIVVHVQPETIGEHNLEAVIAAIATAASDAPQLPVVVDMARVNFMPSVSLAGLIRLKHLFRSRKQRLVLVGLQASIREMLSVTKLDQLFEIHQDLSTLGGHAA